MKKKLVSIIIAMLFGVSMASLSMAASVKCDVKSVDGNTVTLDCGKKAGNVKDMGAKVKAGRVKCKVESVSGSTVTLDCGKKAGKLSGSVKVRAAKKVIEGC